MSVAQYFSADYPEARSKFRAAATAAGASLAALTLPDRCGPGGEELSIDVAVCGKSNADRALLVISGTHGVEGFCGSGCQVGLLSNDLAAAMSDNSALVFVHALNPHGFAWLRRVNEDGIDLNRNFVDFAGPLPASAGYEELHDSLVPQAWDAESRRAADARIAAYIGQHGMRNFQAALSSGQYTRPKGLFYGGTQPAWSAASLRRILREHLPASVQRLAVLDLHTGLGPSGYGEPISMGRSAADFQRAVQWYGADVKDLAGDDSVSARVGGSVADGLLASLPSVEITYVALEFGTHPINVVVNALRADHWLHAEQQRDTPLRAAINREMRDAFFVDTAAWKAAVCGRVADFGYRAARCLAG
jgi:hypothetical protein